MNFLSPIYHTAYHIGRRSLYMVKTGCQESFNQIKISPSLFYEAISNLPHNFAACLDKKMIAYLVITTSALGFYDREYGLCILNNFVIDPIKGIYKLIHSPATQFPVVIKQLMLLTAVGVASLAVGIIVGMTINISLRIVYGFIKGAIHSYSQPL